jgi:hypothetical protein
VVYVQRRKTTTGPLLSKSPATYPETEVSDTAYSALLDLVTDICKRNGIKKLVGLPIRRPRRHLNGCNMTVHRDYANNACPGEWLYSRHGQLRRKSTSGLENRRTKNDPE